MNESAKKRTALIIGAGPAGLTAAYELLKHSDIQPIILEKSAWVGGISRTVRYKGNCMDIGGHRFFSKSETVLKWWDEIMPVNSLTGKAGDMLIRQRKSRIYFLRKLFDYPLSLSIKTIQNLGLIRVGKIGISYLRSCLFPIKYEKNLEEFFINRFGRVLYKTFFKSYTEKVWGKNCKEISSEWGAQRIKGLDISKALMHAARRAIGAKHSKEKLETSLIESFMYPKYGPGQLWEKCAARIEEMGGTIKLESTVTNLEIKDKEINNISYSTATKEIVTIKPDFVISTMAIKDLIAAIPEATVPRAVIEIAAGLEYRDFITVGILLEELKLTDKCNALIKDNWIYIQEPDVQVGRIQIFNNWSPHLLADKTKVWLGMEYFCNKGDKLWNLSDAEMKQFAADELETIAIANKSSIKDSTVIRVEKTYPAYFGTYGSFHEIRDWVNQLSNLYLIGRNGMHRYNNQDHSMLTAIMAAKQIISGKGNKEDLWKINTEKEYHEEKTYKT